MRRSRISKIVIREGLKWRQQATLFGARVDPDFAKEGVSTSSAWRHQPPKPAARSTGCTEGRSGR